MTVFLSFPVEGLLWDVACKVWRCFFELFWFRRPVFPSVRRNAALPTIAVVQGRVCWLILL